MTGIKPAQRHIDPGARLIVGAVVNSLGTQVDRSGRVADNEAIVDFGSRYRIRFTGDAEHVEGLNPEPGRWQQQHASLAQEATE